MNRDNQRYQHLFEGISLFFAFVLLIQILLVLSISNSSEILSFSIACSVVFVWLFFFKSQCKESSNPTLGAKYNYQRTLVIGLLYLGILFILLNFILFEPIHTWDARSIWFFQAKALFYDGGLVKDSVWTNEAYEFAHLDYPKMLPVLAASVANVFGFWNEHLPKLALFILLILPVSVCYFFSRKWWMGIGVFVGVILIARSYLWNGYMDSHLAFYCAVSLILLYRFRESSKENYLFLTVLFMGILINLKNEGTPLFLLMMVALVFRTKISISWKLIVICTISFSGYFYWLYIKKSWGIENDLGLGVQSLPVIFGRVFSAEILELAKYYFFKAWVWFPIMMVGLAGICNKKWVKTNIALILVPVAYTGLVILVYLGTPHGLGWHLDSSVDRVFMPIHAMSLACMLLALEDRAVDSEEISKKEENLQCS